MKSYFGLTKREMETLTLLAKGLSNEEIKEKMNIGTTTLATYMSNIYSKLLLDGKRRSELRLQAVLWYFKNVKHIDLEGV